MKLQTQILVGLLVGAGCGFLFPEASLWVFPYLAEAFLRALKMLIVPLVLASMVVGVGGLRDLRSLGRLGGGTLAYFLASTVVAVSLGLVVVHLVQPGVGTDIVLQERAGSPETSNPSVAQTLVRMVPENIVEALGQAQMLQIIVFALLVGAALASLGEQGRPLYELFESANALMMRLTDWVMRTAPYGVFALMATTVAEVGLEAFKPLTWYVLTVLVGLALHAVLVVAPALHLLGRHRPLALFREIGPALATVFSTASSAAAMPVTMDRLLHYTGVSRRVVSFVIPLGTTMNMNGTALYQGVAVVFFAQIYGIELSLAQLGLIVLTATLAAVAAAGVPSAGFVTMVMIMNAVQVPIEGVGFILGVDRAVDMLRSSVNVWSNATGAVILARLQGEPLQPGPAAAVTAAEPRSAGPRP